MHGKFFLKLFLLLMWSGCLGFSQESPLPSSPVPENQKQIDRLIMQMESWPLQEAQKAANMLIEKGNEALPSLIAALKAGKPPFREGAAYCLGKMKAAESFPFLQQAASDRRLSTRISTFFTAMALIDRDRAYETILTFLESTNQTGHTPAYNALRSMTVKDHFPLLQNSFKRSQSYKARKYIVQLIGQIEGSQSIDFLLHALGDSSAYVSYEAARILANMDLQEVLDKVTGQMETGDKRLKGYFLLILVMQEERYGKKLLKEDWIPSLIASIRSDDPFVKGTAAISLVSLGFSTDNKEVVEVMDKYLVPVLIDVLAAKVYYKDYLSLRETGYRKMVQLTGKDLGPSMDKWWEWWHTASVHFRAIRLLKGISIEEAKGMTLEYSHLGPLESRYVLFLASPTEAKEKRASTRVVVLNWEQTSGLLERLRKMKFFELQAEYGQKQVNASYRLKLTLKNLKKEVTVYGLQAGALKPASDYLSEMMEKNEWQSYWDSSRHPDWTEWYEGEEKWFRETNDPDLRSRRMKRMILSAYGWMKPQERETAAARFLELMEKDNWLPKTLIEWALFHIRSEMEINSSNESLIRALALSKDTFAINPLIEFLILNYSARTRPSLVFLMENLEKKAVVDYLKHPNGHLRSISAEILGKGTPEELIVLYLIGLMKDERVDVRQSAISSLGNFKAKLAWEPLLQMARKSEENMAVRQSAVMAIAKISPSESAPILLDLLQSREAALRSAIAQALGEIRESLTVKTLLSLLHGDSSPIVRQMAVESLLKIGGNEVFEGLFSLAKKGIHAQPRILAIGAMSRMGSPRASDELASLLEEPDEIRLEAAIALSELYDKRAIPTLISLCDHEKQGNLVRKCLERLTLVNFPEQDKMAVKKRYEDWWRIHHHLSTRQWLFDALRIREYNVTPLLDYLLDGSEGPGVIDVLIEALGDRDWHIRAVSCYLLEKFTGQSFGKIYYYTGEKKSSEIARAWKKWQKQNAEKK